MENQIIDRTDTKLIDGQGRVVDYLRLSITDRCNLKCMYCRPPYKIEFLDRSEICSYRELLFVARMASEIGIKKIRLTGGELFLRKEVIEFIDSLNRIENLDEVVLTTNGTMLAPYLGRLKEIGIRRINISLDALSEDLYFQITGSRQYSEVLNSIQKARQYGFKVKINTVVLNGINDTQLIKFIEFFLRDSVEVRFIEFMPICGRKWGREYFFPYKKIKDLISKSFMLTPVPSSGVAREFYLAGKNGPEGKIGIIAPVSLSFCSSCTRIRISSNGELRPCLFSRTRFKLLPILRGNISDEEKMELIRRTIRKAVRIKPWYAFTGQGKNVISMRNLGG